MTRIGIIGRAGRMGEALAVAISANEALALSGGIDIGGDPIALAKASDVIVDFSSPKALMDNLGAGVAASTALVIGTTGLEDHHHQMIDDAALDTWASTARNWTKDGRDAYVFMISGAKVRNPAAAQALIARLG